MDFVKLHGLGNDFVLIDARTMTGVDPPVLARAMGHRRFGVGFDQMLILLDSETADWRMDIYNPDGSRAEMCGNGIRCFLKYLRDAGLEQRDEVVVETLAGPIVPRMVDYDGSSECRVAVDMGEPRLRPSEVPFIHEGERAVDVPVAVDGDTVRLTAVSMGNPHAVVFAPSLAELDWQRLGPALQASPRFPQSVNVEFVEVVSRGELTLRVWERGAGRTLACGTGACAATVAAVLNGLADRRVLVHLEGGDLEIDWRDDNRVTMTGPATTVFIAEWPD